MTDAPIVVIVGLSGTGKTTFLVKLIPVLKSRGLRLAVLKHDAHGFEVDKPGKDSYRMKAAGADSVAICSGRQLAVMETLSDEPDIATIVKKLQPVDLILVEGYKKSAYPKIEIHRAALQRPLLCHPDELLALVTDEPIALDVPQFALDDAAGIAALLIDQVNKPRDG